MTIIMTVRELLDHYEMVEKLVIVALMTLYIFLVWEWNVPLWYIGRQGRGAQFSLCNLQISPMSKCGPTIGRPGGISPFVWLLPTPKSPKCLPTMEATQHTPHNTQHVKLCVKFVGNHKGFTLLSSWTPRAIKNKYIFYIKHHQNGSNFGQIFFMSRYTRYLLHRKKSVTKYNDLCFS